MNKDSVHTHSAPRTASRATTIFATVTFVAGAILLFVSIAVDLDGFWGGALQGSSISLMVVGAYVAGVGSGMRRAAAPASGAWLPSQDASQ